MEINFPVSDFVLYFLYPGGETVSDEMMLSVRTVAEKWGLSTRRVSQLCASGEIKGAVKNGGLWKIPSVSPKPASLRTDRQKEHVRTTALLPCPMGITSYKEVSSECYYVDKTMIIRDIIDDHNKVTLFTRPRRFGKSLMMDMIRTYFEKTEEDTSIYFSSRNIWSCGEAYRTYQGSYPVIFISFKDAHKLNWDDMYQFLLMRLSSEFDRHRNVLESDRISPRQRELFLHMLNGNASSVEAEESLGLLSHVLSAVYSKRVIIIIDEYDTPIEDGFSRGFYDEILSFMRNMFSAALKDNEDLEFGFLTGILRIAKESLFSGLNNIVVNTIIDEKYSQYFGFTPREVEEMASYYGHSDKVGEIAEWYDGYLFGKDDIYNPWSVISYFYNRCVPKSFWSRTSSNEIILDVLRNGSSDIIEALSKLLDNQPVLAVVDTDTIYPEIEKSVDSVFSFLLMTGYLKISEVKGMLDDVPLCSLLIPNREIKGAFRKEIIENISPSSGNRSVIRKFQIALQTDDSETLGKTLADYLLQSASFFDTAGESFYHGMMLGLLAVMADDYIITSNREAGEGRFDIQLEPRNKIHPGIVMEFKASDKKDEEELLKFAGSAVEQILKKKYISDLKMRGILDFQLYGIAFCGKNARVESRRLREDA